MSRARVVRREKRRLEQKQQQDFGRELAARGLMARIDKLNAIMAPGAAFFWHVVKNRIAARETLRPLKDLAHVQAIAVKVLEDDGHDLTGVAIKVIWRPPVLLFQAVPRQEVALDVVTGVQASERGARRLREIAALDGRHRR